MKQENTNLPLWKVLNEQRTRGKFTISPISGDISIGEELAGFISTGKIDAAYTALAVNNLHILAEALEKCKEWFYLNGKGFKLPLDGSPGTPACFHSIEEALNRIS